MGWKFWESKSMDEEIKLSDDSAFIKKGKIGVILFYEDRSFKEFFVKLKGAYKFTLKKRTYIISPKAFIFGKRPYLMYYFNNPFPILFSHQPSNLTSLQITPKKVVDKMDDELKSNLANVYIDGESLHQILSSNVLRKIYDEAGISTKMLLLIIAAVLIVIIIILQVTGVIDITTMFGGKK